LASNPDDPQFDDYPKGIDGANLNLTAKDASLTAVTYDIDREHLGVTTKVFNGNIDGQVAPLRKDVILIDGLSFSVTGPAPGVIGFEMIANAAGALDPPDMAALAFSSSGFPRVDGKDRPEGGYGQVNGSTWAVHAGSELVNNRYGNEAGPFDTFDGNGYIGRSIRELPGWSTIGSDDFEIRFTQACADGVDDNIVESDCLGWKGFEGGALIEVPMAIWNVGPTSDTSDDYRMIPLVCETLCIEEGSEHVEGIYDIGGDHIASGGSNDPYSDYTYWYKPEDNGAAPGEQGYTDFMWGPADVGERTWSRQVIINWNGGSARPYDADMPEPGSIIKYHLKKPNLAGDYFTIDVTGYGTTAPTLDDKIARLADINVVPNPYMGASDYERSQIIDEVRFSNMPLNEPATIRVFTLSGSLIATLNKPSGTNQLSWNLTTDNNLPIGSGIYLLHVDVDGVGTTVIKFAAIKKRIHLNVF